MSENATIFVGGEPVGLNTLDMSFVSDSVVYGADKGYYLAKELGIECDFVIGDFDSSPKPARDDIIVYPEEKDDTDLMLAVKHAIANGCKSFQIYGALGGRADHLFGNIQSLSYILCHGGTGVILGDEDTIRLLPHGSYTIPKMSGYTLSLFAYSESVEKLTIRGAKYNAENISLENSFPLGVSNRFESDSGAEISFESGLLLVIESKR